MKKASIYVETSIISYLAARPSRDLMIVASQQITAEWWVHTIDYLLTWNLRHIDNPALKPRVREICTIEGYRCPEICTPFEIMELR